MYFNPHHPCGWWLDNCDIVVFWYWISIHTTRVGGDYIQYRFTQRNAISIHTTRVGGDCAICIDKLHRLYFNPHHPCGWWLSSKAKKREKRLPISIHTTRVGGDMLCRLGGMYDTISIHTTRVGGDGIKQVMQQIRQDFNPHHPCGWWR